MIEKLSNYIHRDGYYKHGMVSIFDYIELVSLYKLALISYLEKNCSLEVFYIELTKISRNMEG